MDVPFIGGFFTNTRGQQYGPLVRKKKLKKATGSGIVKPDPMAKAPRGPRGKQVIHKRPAFPKRQPVKRRSAKRKAPKARRGIFKKAKKPRKIDTKSVRRHFDDYGTLERNHALYMGFEAHGSKSRMWDILGEAVCKALFAKMKVFPRSYDEPIGVLPYDSFEGSYKRVNVPGGTDAILDNGITFTSTDTLQSVSATLADRMSLLADSTDNASYFAYYLDSVKISNAVAVAADAGKALDTILVKDIGESIVSFRATQLIKLQNLTPNDAGGGELDVVGTNPIAGMKYEFKNHRAKLVSEIQKLATKNAAGGAVAPGLYDVFASTSTTVGVINGPIILHPDDRFVHPPKARAVFTNCAASTPVSMGPGQFKSERTSFTMSHKMSTFVERIYYGGYDKGTWGGITWFGFEKTHRTVGSAALEKNPVKIGFNRELMMSASIVLKTQKSTMKHYDNTSLGAVGVAT